MIRKLLASTAIATVVATGAYAQMTTTEPAAEPVMEMEQQEVQIERAPGHLASNIIGQRVYNSVADDAENIGSVNDIVLGISGEADQVIIGVGGFLGLGRRDVAIDYNELEWVERDGQWWLVANMTREQLEAAPEFDKTAYDPALGLPPESDDDVAITDTETDETVGDTAAVGGDDITESEADMTAADEEVVDQDVATAPADGTETDDEMAAAPATDEPLEDDTAAAPATDEALEDDTAVVTDTDEASEDVAAAPATDEALEDDTAAVTETDEASEDVAAAPATDEAVEDDTAAAPATDPMETAAIDRSTLQGVEENQLRAEDLIGTTIYGANEENIGSVGDILLSEDGNVDALIIDVGGFLGIGAKEVAVGFENLEFMRDEDGNLYLYTQFTKEQLEAQPEFDDTTYADQRDQQRIVVQ